MPGRAQPSIERMKMNINLRASPQTVAAADWRSALLEVADQISAEGQACDRENRFVGANLDALANRGFFTLGVPAELGGGGADYSELCAMLRAVGALDGSTALALSMHTHQVVVADLRRRAGAPTEALLRRVAEGLRVLSSGGSDWLAGSGVAEPVEGGWRVTGRKVFSSGSPAGDLMMTCAVHGDEVLHFPVPMSDPAVRVLDTWDTLGMRGTGSHDVAIEGVFIPEAAVSGRRPKGKWHPLFHLISKAAMPLIYSVYAGVGDGMRDAALSLAAERSADALQLVRVGELETAHTGMDVLVRAMIALGAEADPGPETTNRVMMLRTLVARAALEVAERAMACGGGHGFYRSSGLEQRLRDTQAVRYHPLADGMQQTFAGRMALGLDIDG